MPRGLEVQEPATRLGSLAALARTAPPSGGGASSAFQRATPGTNFALRNSHA